MNTAKRAELINEFSGQSEIVVPIERFFDGNDDTGSIGCNLPEHPGMDTFRTILTGLLARPDVKAVYARIFELDPGEGSWPFTDTVFVVGKISLAGLKRIVAPLQPDEVAMGNDFGIPKLIADQYTTPVKAIWWD